MRAMHSMQEGCGWMLRILDRIDKGNGRKEDIDLLVDVANNIEGNTICAFGDAAALPVKFTIQNSEILNRIRKPDLNCLLLIRCTCIKTHGILRLINHNSKLPECHDCVSKSKNANVITVLFFKIYVNIVSFMN
jgi:hypothetical protein